ncbi:MAG: type IV pilus modification PilV family protein [Rubripirellula sp.]
MTFSPSRRSAGFTLLEVVIGLTLMASVVVASLLAFTAHRKQRRLADAKIAAVAIADDLLNQLSARRNGIPVAERGVIQGRPNWFWQTQTVGTMIRAQVPLRVIEFQVIEVSENGWQPLVSTQLVEKIIQ